MIRLTKGVKPQILTDSAQAWTVELIAALANGDDVSSVRARRYGHKDIKSALLQETNEKCAYCESKPLHVDYGDVEHIVPKSVDPAVTYDWDNLTIACGVCNTNKRDAQGLIDPYNNDPSALLEFHGPWISHIPGADIGRLTILVLKLNRTPLMERRGEKIKALRDQLDAIVSVADASVRTTLLQAIVSDARQASNEFSACLSAFISVLATRGHLPAAFA